MEPNEFYVYPGTYYVCGACSFSLSPYRPDVRPYKHKVCCFNQNCPKFLIVYEIGHEARVPVFDTGERAPDPRVLTTPGAVGITQAQNIGAAMGGAPTGIPVIVDPNEPMNLGSP